MNANELPASPKQTQPPPPSPSVIQKYFHRKLLYNGPMLIDVCKQPHRFAIAYYASLSMLPPLMHWLKRCTSYATDDAHQYDDDHLCAMLFNPIGKLAVAVVSRMFHAVCPQSLRTRIGHPFEWSSYHYHVCSACVATVGVSASYIRSVLYFRRSINQRLAWPYVYDAMMNKHFTQCIRELLSESPLDDNFHITLTLKLFPIIQYNYFDAHSTKAFELKIAQFTAANTAWYCTKWNRVSIQAQQHRIVGAFLCDYRLANSHENEQEQRKSEKKEIRETIMRIQKTHLNGLCIDSMLDWCKNMCLTLQSHFEGEWAVLIGHRAQLRAFHSVILEDTVAGNDYIDPIQSVQKVPLQVNNKTDAEYLHFGIGPRWYQWSVIVAKIE